MLNVRQTVASAIGLAVLAGGLAGCGQRGGLYLPTDPAAKGRATLPQTLLPDSLSSKPSAGATPAANANNGTSNNPTNGTTSGVVAPAIPPGASVIPSSTASPVDGSP